MSEPLRRQPAGEIHEGKLAERLRSVDFGPGPEAPRALPLPPVRVPSLDSQARVAYAATAVGADADAGGLWAAFAPMAAVLAMALVIPWVALGSSTSPQAS